MLWQPRCHPSLPCSASAWHAETPAGMPAACMHAHVISQYLMPCCENHQNAPEQFAHELCHTLIVLTHCLLQLSSASIVSWIARFVGSWVSHGLSCLVPSPSPTLSVLLCSTGYIKLTLPPMYRHQHLQSGTSPSPVVGGRDKS